MDQPKLTREARCLTIVAGDVLERCIEDRAREIAGSRAAAEIIREDVLTATAEFLAERLSDLPHLIQQAVNRYEHRPSRAA